MKNILMLASEAVPFIKTGGLADVVGSLPKTIDKQYYDCRVMIPKYMCIPWEWRQKMEYVTHFYMNYLGQDRYVGVLKYEHQGVTYYFIDNESYFSGDRPYGDWYWDLEKFCFFCYAALSALPLLDWHPDVIHCHDWQTGLVPVLLHDRFAGGEYYRSIKSVITIHNLKFQGVWDVKTIQRFTQLSDYYFTPDKLECKKDGNLLKGGIVYADAITTVSDTYAEEIKMPFYGEGLDGLLRARAHDLRGIVNGIDYDDWNPETDKYLVKPFNARNFRKEKAKNKNMFRHYDWKYHDKVSAQIYYSNEISHKIYASCDAYLMPSLFEPCGLSQLIALRYGTVPIVRETGGLRDTVQPYNEYEDSGTGFSFSNYNAHEMLGTIRYAESVYYDHKREWNKLVDRAMAADYSWKTSAMKYQELYDWLIGY